MFLSALAALALIVQHAHQLLDDESAVGGLEGETYEGALPSGRSLGGHWEVIREVMRERAPCHMKEQLAQIRAKLTGNQ